MQMRVDLNFLSRNKKAKRKGLRLHGNYTVCCSASACVSAVPQTILSDLTAFERKQVCGCRVNLRWTAQKQFERNLNKILFYDTA